MPNLFGTKKERFQKDVATETLLIIPVKVIKGLMTLNRCSVLLINGWPAALTPLNKAWAIVLQ